MSSLLVSTEKGEFKIELHSDQAPKTCEYFERLAEHGDLNGAQVFRIVNTSNDLSAESNQINVLQIGSSRGLDEERKTIPHESTDITGLKHHKWTVSAARYAPGNLYKSFFICMDNEPELDFGGLRHLDEQGFAVFGQISQGHDVVEDIFSCAEPDEILAEPIAVSTISNVQKIDTN